jgi:hypothetical protein
LIYFEELCEETKAWASPLKELLLEMKGEAERACAEGATRLAAERLAERTASYEKLVAEGLRTQPPPEVPEQVRKQARNLLLRTIRDVAGAFARDLLLELHHGFKAQRATNDVDFGVRVERWEEFEALKRALVGTGRYSPDLNKAQRLISGEGGLIDVVPFGRVEDARGRITWPPEHEVVMNALGFEESFEL